jgi:hypothetical protein
LINGLRFDNTNLMCIKLIKSLRTTNKSSTKLSE